MKGKTYTAEFRAEPINEGRLSTPDRCNSSLLDTELTER